MRTLKGKVAVNIPKGTPNGKDLSLRGLGMPVYGKKKESGNLQVKVNIVLPEHLSTEEMEMFKKLAALKKERHDRENHDRPREEGSIEKHN